MLQRCAMFLSFCFGNWRSCFINMKCRLAPLFVDVRFEANHNCFIRWVLILSRTSSRIDPESDARCTGRQHSKKHSQTQLLLNETRDLHAKHVTSQRHKSSVDHPNSCRLTSTHLTSCNCSRIISLPHEPNWELEATSSLLNWTEDWSLDFTSDQI